MTGANAATVAYPGFDLAFYLDLGTTINGNIVYQLDADDCPDEHLIPMGARPTVNNNQLTGGMIGSSQTICAGSDPAAFSSTSAASGGTGMLSYQWQSSANMNGPFSAIMGTNSTTYDLPMQNMAGTTYYRRRVTDANQAEAFSNVINVV
ncbi:MAG: hypothetical protein ACK5XP_03820, partial [Sphingobacteriia bacterium]